ncbi:unnamed protein product [Brassica oleracea var. botrytis]
MPCALCENRRRVIEDCPKAETCGTGDSYTNKHELETPEACRQSSGGDVRTDTRKLKPEEREPITLHELP